MACLLSCNTSYPSSYFMQNGDSSNTLFDGTYDNVISSSVNNDFILNLDNKLDNKHFKPVIPFDMSSNTTTPIFEI